MSKNNVSTYGVRTLIITVIIMAFAVTMIAENNNAEYNEENIFAEYRDGVFTRQDFEAELETIPFMYKSRFTTLEGQIEFLETLILSRIFHKKAVELGIDQRDDTKQAIENALRPYYIAEFKQREIFDKIEIPKAEIEAHYQENIDRFRVPANTVIRYIMAEDEQQAAEARAALDSGTDFIDVMNRYSVSSFAKRHNGFIRNIRGNGYIAGVGIDDDLDGSITEAPLNTWIGPLSTKSGHHIFQVTERSEARLKPVSEVRDEIRERLAPRMEREYTERKVTELRNKYEVVIDNEVLETVNLMDSSQLQSMGDKIVAESNNEDLQLRVRDLFEAFQRLTQQERAQIDNPLYKAELVNRIIKDRIFFTEAKNIGFLESLDPSELTLDPTTHRYNPSGHGEREVDIHQPDAERIRRNIIVQKLFEEKVVQASRPTDEEVEAFYNDNPHFFRQRGHRSVQLFTFEGKREANRARREVSRAVNASDEDRVGNVLDQSLFRDQPETIPQIYRDGDVIQAYDEDSVLADRIWDTKVGEVSRVGRKADDQYFFVRILEETPTQVRELDEVRTRIIQSLARDKQDEMYRQVRQELYEEFEVVTHPERLARMMSAQELFDLAEEAQNRKRFADAIKHYEQIVDYHKNDSDDYKALFMKAFLIAEELGDKEKAIALFKKVIQDYSQGDLHESAEFMIYSLENEDYDVFENLGKE